MDRRAYAGYIDEAVQDLPLPAEPADPSFRRGDCQRNHENKGGESHRDEWALHHILDDQVPGEELIDADVDGEVHTHVEKHEQAQHPSVLDHAIPSGYSTYRCDRERQHEEPQRPDAGGQFQVFNGIDAETARERSRDEPRERSQAEEKDTDLGGLLHADFVIPRGFAPRTPPTRSLAW